MKATDKLPLSPQTLAPRSPATDPARPEGVGRADPSAQVAPIAAQALGHSSVDRTEQAPVRLADGAPASSVASTGQSSQLALRAARSTGRGAGVRTKKLKTENVGSLSRPARAMFQAVLDTAARGKQILAAKQAPTAQASVAPRGPEAPALGRG